MSKEFKFEEILNDGMLGGEMESIRFKNPDLNRHLDKLLEVHAQPGEVFCLMDPSKFNLKIDPHIKSVEVVPVEGEPTKCMIVTRVHGIGDSPE